MKLNAVVSFVLMQMGWFACVAGAAHGSAWIGPLVVLATLVRHVAAQARGQRTRELGVLVAAAALGFVVDTVLLRAGVTTMGDAEVAPLWLVALWPNLAAATAPTGSLARLAGRPILGAALGAILGPLAYYSGARLGAIGLLGSARALVVLGAVWLVVLPLFFRLRTVGRRAVPRTLLVAGAFATTLLLSGPSEADDEAAALRGRFAGFYRYAGDASEQRARTDAIERSVNTFFFAVRGVARDKLTDRTRIMPTCRFEFSGGNIRSTVPGHAVAVSPETGAPAPYRVGDDAIVLTQRFEGGRLVQVFRADEGGTRRNEFTLSADGKVLTMKASLSSPKLSIPVVYTLTYRRVE